MHIIGKILAWALIPILSLLAVGLSANMVVMRNRWTQEAEATATQIVEAEQEVEKQNRALKDLQIEYDMTMLGWDRIFTPRPVQIGNNGAVNVAQLGARNGLDTNQVLHAFQPIPQQNNAWRYIGPFRVVAADADASTLRPDWTVLPGEIQSWNQQAPWRFRTMIPVEHFSRFTGLDREVVNASNRLNRAQQNVARQNELIQKATEHLDLRRGELLGQPANETQRDILPNHMIDGLVQAIKDEEDARNTAILEVDQLRRQRNQAYSRYQQLQAENRALYSDLLETLQNWSRSEGSATTGL